MDWFKTEGMRRKEKVTDHITSLLCIHSGDHTLKKFEDTPENREIAINFINKVNEKHSELFNHIIRLPFHRINEFDGENYINVLNIIKKSGSDLDLFIQADINSLPSNITDKSKLLDWYNKGLYNLEDFNKLFKGLGFSPYYYQRFENSPKVIWFLGNLNNQSKKTALEYYSAGTALINKGITNNAAMIFIEESLVKDQTFSDAWIAKGGLFTYAGYSVCAQRCNAYGQKLRTREIERVNEKYDLDGVPSFWKK
jgi:hypothetical protein